MKGKFLLSFLVLALVSALVGGATMAWFTDDATNAGNTFTAGTLVVDVNGSSDSQGGAFSLNLGTISNMAPGDATRGVSLEIKNNGTLPLAWFGYFDLSGVDGGGTELAEAIYIQSAKMEFFNADTTEWETADTFITGGTGSGPYGAYYTQLANNDPLGVVSLKTWNEANAMGAGGGVQMGALKPDNYYRFTFTLAFAEGAGNEYQGLDMNVGYTVKATQITAGALDALFDGDSRLQGPGSNHLAWLNAQIAKQD